MGSRVSFAVGDRANAGSPSGWVKYVVVFALVATVAIAVIGPRLFWTYYGMQTGFSGFWFCNGLVFVIGAGLLVALVPRLGPSRWLGLIVALPIVHALAMGLAWAAWSSMNNPMGGYRASRLIEAMPIGTTIQLVGLVLVATSWLVARGRRGEWGHTLVMLALASVLLLGLWLPIASALWCWFDPLPALWERTEGWKDSWQVTHRLFSLVVLPPWLAATAFTALAVRRPARLSPLSRRIWVGLAVLFCLAVRCRLDHTEPTLIVYSNFMHVLLAVAFVSLIAIAWLALRLALRSHRAAAVLRDDQTLRGEVVGPVDDADQVVAHVELTSWLRGPRALLRGFRLRIAGGEVVIPGGAWASPLTASTTRLALGESQAVLCAGDRVVVAGMELAGGAQPFRGTARWVAGTTGIWVGAPGPQARSLDHLMLALWRPCVAYLLILIGVAAPALIAAIPAAR